MTAWEAGGSLSGGEPGRVEFRGRRKEKGRTYELEHIRKTERLRSESLDIE
jgi:hypothetical protein